MRWPSEREYVTPVSRQYNQWAARMTNTCAREWSKSTEDQRVRFQASITLPPVFDHQNSGDYHHINRE
ncbi:MAG: hypothetical protein CM1200mP32_11260 [Methanobacteriota archaeon]|nr:MAG: hypothetical protein CM1200mP32_11260 [Euryarchaeota archaeon]